MERTMFRVEGEAKGWACSNCSWRFPVPTLLGGEEAMAAYDRLAAAKFREHRCEAEGGLPAPKPKEEAKPLDSAFAERARVLIKRGYKPKVAVELILHETEIEYRSNPKIMAKARADAEDFLLKVRKGLI